MFDEDDEPITSSDTDNATTFHPAEAPPELRRLYERLFKYNIGDTRTWSDHEALRKRDNLALYDAISSQVDLTKDQRRRGRELFDRLNVRRIGYGAELVAFCVCIHVAEQDGRRHVFNGGELNDDPFLVVAGHQAYSTTRIFACLSAVKEALRHE